MCIRDSAGPAQLQHAYVASPAGVLELRGASIHPTADAERKTPPKGYFLCARLWDAQRVRELGMLIGGEARLIVSPEAPGRQVADPETVVTRTPLTGLDGSTVATLEMRIASPTVAPFLEASRATSLLGGGLALSLLAVLSWVLVAWVVNPLRRLSVALASGRRDAVVPLLGHRTEFGEMANMVDAFFSQQRQLVVALDQQRAATEALRTAGAVVDEVVVPISREAVTSAALVHFGCVAASRALKLITL